MPICQETSCQRPSELRIIMRREPPVESIFWRWPPETQWSAHECPVHLTQQLRVTVGDAVPRVALLMSGALATARGRAVMGVYQIHDRVWQSTAAHVVDALERDSAVSVQTFLCLDATDAVATNASAEDYILQRLRVAEVYRSAAFGSGDSPRNSGRDELSWARAKICLQRALHYEQQQQQQQQSSKGHGSQRRSRSFYYSHFLRGRPDLVWYRPIPPLSASLHVVAVRAWLLHMGGGGRAVFVSRDHLVGGGGCMSQVRRGRPLETRH